MFRYVLLGALVALFFSSHVFAQGPAAASKPSPRTSAKSDSDDGGSGGNLPEEMRSRMEIDRANKEYDKLVDSAKQLNEACSEFAKQYKADPRLTAEQTKRLASIEKLAKHILSESGGEETDAKLPDEVGSVSDAVDRLAAKAAGVEKTVTAQTRFVVSASAIGDSNELIHLAQYIRRPRAQGSSHGKPSVSLR
jgi:hypothetical protein